MVYLRTMPKIWLVKISLWSQFKGAAPHAIQLRCISNSYDLALKSAFNNRESIPGWFHLLIKEVPSLFSHSAIRWEVFKSIRAKLNKGKKEQKPSVIKKACPTCWLVLRPVTEGLSKTKWSLYNILRRW